MSIMQYFNLDSAPLPLAWDPSWVIPDAWFDPSDASTVFVDRAGTVPATAGDPVGQIRDKSGKGNHAVAPTDAARPTLARMPATGRRNLLTYTEDFNNAAWSKTAGITVTDGASDPGGGNTATRINFGDANRTLTQSITGVTDQRLGRIWIKGTAGETIQFSVGIAETKTLNGQWQLLQVSAGAGPAALFQLTTFSGSTARVIDIWRPQIELGAVETPYQKVTNDFDVTEAGVPDVWSLELDGVDDTMSTQNITMTENMYVAASMQVNSYIIENSGSPQAFGLWSFDNRLSLTIRSQSTAFAVGVNSRRNAGASNILAAPLNLAAGNGAFFADSLLTSDGFLDLKFKSINGTEYSPTPLSGVNTDSPVLSPVVISGGQNQSRSFYGGVVLTRKPLELERTLVSKYLADKAGVAL